MNNFFFRKLSAKDKIVFTKRLSLLLTAGIPLSASLAMLKKQSNSHNLRDMADTLLAQVEQGQSLQASLRNYQREFGSFTLNLVRIGEITGTLPENLKHISERLQKAYVLKRKVVGSLVYPACILLATLVIVVMLLVFVFPKILPALKSLNATLPVTTRMLIALSNVFMHQWLLLLIYCAILACFVALLFGAKTGRRWTDKIILRLPFIGSIFRNYHTANLCRNFALLLESKVGIAEAARITSQTATNTAYSEALITVSEALTRGEAVATSIQKYRSIFPYLVGDMISVGESTGNLSGSLTYLAEIYEAEVDDQTKNLSTIIEPVLMIFMGVLVGFIAISIITPIYGITQNLHP